MGVLLVLVVLVLVLGLLVLLVLLLVLRAGATLSESFNQPSACCES